VDFLKGIINILKPSGMTSHDVVSRLRKIFNMKKIGHTGTLDPNASGVLPICLGKATKISEYILNKDKKYRCEVYFGIKTSTYDSYGEILESKVNNDIKKEDIENALKDFKGNIKQTPPIYSALKLNGKKLYEYARENKEVNLDIKKREVFIKDIKLISFKENRAIIDVECSKGTYIRSIANDLGEKLNTVSYMSFLLRTKSGRFSLEDAITLEELELLNDEDKKLYIKDIDYPLYIYDFIKINSLAKKAFINGGVVYNKGIIGNLKDLDTKIFRVYTNEDEFLGLGKIVDEVNIRCEKLLL
jgi:tRNA pseudouridine55 synthase